MKVYVELNKNFTEEIKYIWSVFAGNKGVEYSFVEAKEEADFVIDTSPSSDLCIAESFWNNIAVKNYFYGNFFVQDCLVRTVDGRPDYLATAFYMINSIQEFGSTDLDEIGRFKYANSYQYKFGNIEQNLVQECFDKLIDETPKLKTIKSFKVKSGFCLSHDIDSVNGAFLQDGLFALKRGRVDIFLKLLFNVVTRNPDWLNMDKIMNMEDEYSFKSTFYWLVNKGTVNKRMTNSDYDINSKVIRRKLDYVSSKGWENGLHKSVSTERMSEEIEKLELHVIGNRYHYLRFTLPNDFNEIEKSGILFDTSLGFAEAYGFRNSYGLPFQPYSCKERRKYKFIEVPLNIMDGTFQRYMKVPCEDTANRAISFFEKNKENCLFSVLWHNTFFTNYKYAGYLNEYKKILEYFYHSKSKCFTQQQIINEYLIKQ